MTQTTAGIVVDAGLLCLGVGELNAVITSYSIHYTKLYDKAAKDETNLYNQRDTAMLSIYYGCGLRASEGAALNINDLLFDKNLLYVRKGKGYRERYVPINKQVKTDLQEYIFNQRNELLNNKKSEALLLGRRGERWSVHGVYGRLQLLKSQTNNEVLKQKSFGRNNFV